MSMCLFEDVLSVVKNRHPQVKRILLRTDNGPHYKAKSFCAMLAEISTAYGLQVTEWCRDVK
jgi:hypothetical protein